MLNFYIVFVIFLILIRIIIVIFLILIRMITFRLFWSTLRVPMEASHGFRLTDKRQQQDRCLHQMLIIITIITIMMLRFEYIRVE